MKKNKFTEFFKGKGYYVLLFVGVLAIAAVAIIGSRLTQEPQNEGEDFDLNEPDNNIAAEEDEQLRVENDITSGDVANHEDNTAQKPDNQELADNDSLLEYDIYTQEEENGIDLAEAAEAEEKKTAEEEPEAVETSGKTVEADNRTHNLKFNVDQGLLWPVEGNVIMPYSMEHTTYFATLMQFKCNPAIIIDAEVGTEVRAATDGVVTSIDTNEETGLTITTDIGNGFSLVYGQLAVKDKALKVGDRLKEGDIIGTVNVPTKYYSVEGSNLYFQVLENNETVNPMLYLR